MNHRGVSIIELLAVVVVLGILVNLALPVARHARRKADAVAVLAVFHAVRVAARDRFAAEGRYPANGGWGVVPSALVPALPDGLQFATDHVEFRWRRWALPNGLPTNARRRVLLALDVRSSDRALLKAVRGLYRGPIVNLSNTTLTLVID
jgi:prepilin-type N-terminal cleavage/methylation domain-containing protein